MIIPFPSNRKKPTSLALESGSTYLIKDEHGNVVSLAEAKRRWQAGVDDWNVSFDRLAREFHFDLDALKAYYAEATRIA